MIPPITERLTTLEEYALREMIKEMETQGQTGQVMGTVYARRWAATLSQLLDGAMLPRKA